MLDRCKHQSEGIDIIYSDLRNLQQENGKYKANAIKGKFFLGHTFSCHTFFLIRSHYFFCDVLRKKI